uniref:large ribosomal subunit protein uL30m-like isoform X3 n=1 Tax=Myxine glutinosa TaxID=7769 RepID=UPI00358E9FD3
MYGTLFGAKVLSQRRRSQEYGGDPEQPHQVHVVYRIRSALRRPYWEKNMVKMLGLTKKRYPIIHKNTPSVNNRLNTIRHLIQQKEEHYWKLGRHVKIQDGRLHD